MLVLWNHDTVSWKIAWKKVFGESLANEIKPMADFSTHERVSHVVLWDQRNSQI